MITVDLKEIKKNFRAAVDYLRSRLDEPIELKGSRARLKRTNAKTAKILLHKLLHQLQLEEYRIVIVKSGLIEVHAPKKEKQRNARATQGAKPSAWETIPDL